MKRKILDICVLMAALLCGCGEKENQTQEKTAPASFSGKWAFTETLSGESWVKSNVKDIFDFDGAGNYTILRYSGTDRVQYQDGILSVAENEFKVTGTTGTCSVKGDSYSFSSLGASYELVSSTAECFIFSFRKFSRVTGFDASGGESTDLNPDREGYINNTFIESGNNMVGVIKDASTGKGIPNVVVSDGYSTVKTDANGVYQFKASTAVQASTRYVFYSTPSAYKVETDNGIPNFYKLILSVPKTGWSRNDWTLTPLDTPESKWTFVGIGDSQCGSISEVNRYTNETIADMKSYLTKYQNPYAVVLGDIIHDSNNIWPYIKNSMSGVNVNGRALPFFQVMGNHDHNALEDNAYDAVQLYVDHFGPENYSFNRGDVHVVCFDNVIVEGRSTSSQSNTMTWNTYGSGMTDTQLEWFKKDMSFVENKGDKMLILCCHIPFADASPKHRTEIMSYMKQFKEAHILAGHTHYNRNYLHNSFVCKGGNAVYEHIHGTACGAWWEAQSSCNTTGAPSGYTVYEIEGASIVNWVMKGTGKSEEHQFRVYDGNQTYTGTRGYTYNWYRTDNTGGSSNIVAKGYSGFKNSFVVEVFDDDTKYVNVELYQNGIKLGDFKHLSRGTSANICACSWFFNERGKNSTTWNSTAGSYWYYPTTDPVPSDMTDWEVRMTRTIPGSGRRNVYTSRTLTKDYSDFKRQ